LNEQGKAWEFDRSMYYLQEGELHGAWDVFDLMQNDVRSKLLAHIALFDNTHQHKTKLNYKRGK
jgi:hypothetical protein